MRVILLLGALFLSSAASAKAPRCQEIFIRSSTLAEEMWAMSLRGQLLRQSDDRLRAQGWMIEGGGLCASTCATNILHTIHLRQFPRKDFDQVQTMKEVIQVSKDFFGTDARVGMTSSVLARTLQNMQQKKGQTPLAIARFQNFQIDELTLRDEPNTLNIIYVDYYNLTHALVMMGINSVDQIISFIDPNHPQKIQFVHYEKIDDDFGDVRIRLWLGEGRADGLISDQIRIRIKDERDYL